LDDIDRESDLRARLHHVERRVDNHDHQIRRLSEIAEHAEETVTLNREMVRDIHIRMDKQDLEQLRLADVEKVVRDQVPAMVTVGIENSIGKWATRIILAVVSTSAMVILSHTLKHWLA